MEETDCHCEHENQEEGQQRKKAKKKDHIKEMEEEFPFNFEVHCCPGQKYDFSAVKYNNVIDGELRDLKANITYPVTNIQEHIKKYDIDTDRIDEVTIITLQTKDASSWHMVAPYALIEYLEMISDKIDKVTSLNIVRKENEVIHVFVKD